MSGTSIATEERTSRDVSRCRYRVPLNWTVLGAAMFALLPRPPRGKRCGPHGRAEKEHCQRGPVKSKEPRKASQKEMLLQIQGKKSR
jgi:hypothetical protein